MNNTEKIKAIQRILEVSDDGIYGKKTDDALVRVRREADRERAVTKFESGEHSGKASSFADSADIRAFRICKAAGGSDLECFEVGDNGIGCYGDDVSEGSGPSCALPPEDSEEKWGSVAAARHKPVRVTANGKTEICILKDRMPHRANIKNGAIIDLNPDAAKALDLSPPFMVPCSWQWL